SFLDRNQAHPARKSSKFKRCWDPAPRFDTPLGPGWIVSDPSAREGKPVNASETMHTLDMLGIRASLRDRLAGSAVSDHFPGEAKDPGGTS
ncbi:hypothetical protein MMC31_000682, partial [Peltigera leucophlebia]|nr:hypothetical protein [Peltigera leucophlebia]